MIVGFVVSGATTEYETVLVLAFPARSVAVTPNACGPSVAVSIACPSGTVPMHVATPEPPDSSAHA